MGANLLPVWQQIKIYLNEGISIIPVRDKTIGDELAKTPFKGYVWKQYQRRIITEQILFNDLDKLNTEAVAIICGAVSGNLEIIDIDIKNKADAAEKLFESIKLLYPEILNKLRIHKTPSGGFHLLYRSQLPVPGNKKLAQRPNPNAPPKNLCFIETRGEGGYAVAPPAMGYTIVKENELPILTELERSSLLQCCKELDETTDTIPLPAKTTATESEIYDVTPFDDFNNNCDAVAIAESEGWRALSKRSSRFTWFTRPGKTSGVSMSFNNEKRFFYCFTSSTDLQPDKGYTPANFLSILKFNNDKKLLYNYLVGLSYGKIKSEVEKRIVKKASINNEPLPANISKDSIELYNTKLQLQQTNNPYGLFWFEGRFGMAIDRESIIRVSTGLGFRLYNDEIFRINGRVLHKQTQREYYDAVKEYIHEDDEDTLNEIYNAWEAFIEQHGKFTVTRLDILGHDQVLKDTKTDCYKCYENGILHISKESISLLQYNFTSKYIFQTSLLPRPFSAIKDVEKTDFLYPDFLRKAIGDITPYLFKVIGYLSHEYKDETTGYIVFLSEQCENPRDGGGSGKNIFSSMFRHITTYHGKPGTGIKYDEKFLQSWSGQRLMCISDVEKNFKFLFLKELSTGTGLQKKLFSDEREIPVEQMPKFIVSSNYSFDNIDGGVRRRVMPVEFTNFFTKTGGVDVHFKAHFPNDFKADDWAAFDSITAKGVFLWLNAGLKLEAPELTAGGWAKQFEQTHGATATDFIKEHITAWVHAGFVANYDFKKDLDSYRVENSIKIDFMPSNKRLVIALTDYCKHEKILFDGNHLKSINGIKVKGKLFETAEVPF